MAVQTKTPFALKAIRVNCQNDACREVELQAELYYNDQDELWCKIIQGGVTGYESVRPSDLLRTRRERTKTTNLGWHANAGTRDSWDVLYVLAESVDLILRKAELLP